MHVRVISPPPTHTVQSTKILLMQPKCEIILSISILDFLLLLPILPFALNLLVSFFVSVLYNVHAFMASLLYCSPYIYRSSTFFRSEKERQRSLLHAIVGRAITKFGAIKKWSKELIPKNAKKIKSTTNFWCIFFGCTNIDFMGCI